MPRVCPWGSTFGGCQGLPPSPKLRKPSVCGTPQKAIRYLLPIFCLFLFTNESFAAKIGEITQLSLAEQVFRFFSFQDPSLRYALMGSILLGISCGLLGCFIVVRKMALMGDALSHAVLPGVVLGFLWNMTKDPLSIFIGATVAGLLGTAAVSLITHTTRLKDDTSIGIVLTSFFSVGICMVTMLQRLPTGNKSGIDKFLFGQAAAMSEADIRMMAIVTILVIISIYVFYKEFLVTSFDIGFARAVGFPTHWIHHSLMFLLASAVVIALQAVGVVLVSAMLIIPAAAAYLLTDRMHRMLWISSLLGMTAGVIGAFLSFLGNNLPTGPFMVLGCSISFAIAFLFAPQHGVVLRWLRQLSHSKNVQRENTLKAMYHVLEARDFLEESISIQELAERRHESREKEVLETSRLQRHGLATLHQGDSAVAFTPEGWRRACAIVRNHRLWELYLTNAAHIPADHVHEDAEKIEHVLGEEVVMQLEKRLQYAKKDPHGRPIPSLQDMHQSFRKQDSPLQGYGRKIGS